MSSLIGLGRLIFSAADRMCQYGETESVQDSALLNYVKPWLEHSVWEDCNKKVNILSVYVRVGSNSSISSRTPAIWDPVTLYIDFEGRVPAEVGYYEWKNASLSVSVAFMDLVADSSDEFISDALVRGIRESFRRLDTSEYIDLGDFLEADY